MKNLKNRYLLTQWCNRRNNLQKIACYQYRRIAKSWDKIQCLYIFQNPIDVWHSFRATRASSLVAYLSLAQAGFKVHFIISMFQGLPLHGRTFTCTNKTMLVVTQSKHNSNSITNWVIYLQVSLDPPPPVQNHTHTRKIKQPKLFKNQKQKWEQKEH